MQKISKITAAPAAVKKRLTCCCKMIAAFALCLLLILSGFVLSNFKTAFADGEKPFNSPVKACVFNLDGYHERDENGKLTGYGIEFLNLVSEYSHINFEFIEYNEGWNWKEISQMLRDGKIDIVTSVTKNTDREAEFAFSLPMGRKSAVLTTSIDNNIQRGDYSTYKGKNGNMTVGMIKDNSANVGFEDFAENKFEYIKDDRYTTDKELADALKRGDIDAILTSDLRKTENEKTLDIISENYFYAVVRKEDKGLLDEINYAIDQMDINEGDWQNVLFYKYYGPVYSSSLSFTEREKKYIEQVKSGEKTITVTAFGGRAPYSYTENGELKGVIPDYFAEVMKLAGLPYETVIPKDHDDYHRLVDNGVVNVVMDNMGDGDSGFNTNSYMTSSMVRVRRHDFNGDIKVVAVCESQGKDLIPHELLKGLTVKEFTTGEEAMQAVLDKKADAALVYAYTAQLFVNRDSTNTLYYSMMNGMSTTFSMHISDDTDHELITILNKCIKQTSEETLNQLVSNYTSITIDDLSFMQYLQAHPEIWISVLLVLVVIVCVILAFFLRARWNRKLLQATEQTNRKMVEQLAIVEALSRDYTNVYSVNEEKSTARVVKLEGYVAEGLKKGSAEEYNYAAVLEKYINSRVHPDDRLELAQALALNNVKEKLSEADEYQGSYRIVENGEIHNYQYTYLKITDTDNEHDGFILLGFRNIDEMIRKEQEQKNVLSEALAQAQYANKAKTTFLNNMSHDIRTPMNAIIGFTSLAVTHLDNKEQIRNYLSKIMTSGNHLLSLINDVLDMSRIESGKVKIEEKETSLPEIMHDLKTIVQADVKSKQLEFYIDTLDVTNETIICDKLRLNQVLLNILSNAMKYTKPGGMVSVRVIQTADAPEGYASYQFSVKDTGIGMSPEFLQHVFEPFEREQTSTVSGIQGTGLGLAITKNIVDMMGGTITVESEVGKGSEFTVKFCFRVADAPAETQKLEQLENLRALVVDDDVNTCVSVSKMLSTIGMRPDWTTLGNEAIIRTEFALEQKEPYSAYIIDWLMPDMNGIELVRRIRRRIGDLTPVIILTAYDWTDIEKEAKEAGVTAFCSKPLFLSELRNVLAAPYKEKESVKEEVKEEIRFDGKRLLLVEDNELNQEIAQTILEAAGFEIDTADDGSVAVELVKKKPAGTYDLILMDVQMPIMNGYQATKAIRELKDAKKAKTPIVAMTANAFDEDRKEAMEAGMNGYVDKPISIEKLMKTIEDLLK